ncbi:MAG: hypothetical protein C4313_00225 [Thermoflexus sp.]
MGGSAAPLAIASIHMVDEKTGWAMSADGRVLRTTDGGQTWIDVTPSQVGNRPPSIVGGLGAFAGASKAWYLDVETYVVYGSSDGGHSWERLAAIKPDIIADGGVVLTFADSRHGWIEVMSGAHHSRGEIFTTADGGRTWTQVYAGGLAGDLRFKDAGHGWLSTGAALYRTEDGGKTWNKVNLPGGAPSWVGLPLPLGSKLILLAVEEGSNRPQLTIFASDSTGGSWEVLFTHEVRSISTATSFAVDGLHAWVATTDGSLGVRTKDAGRHWESFSTPEGFNVRELDFVSPNVGWMVAQDRKSYDYALFQTDDGGQTWIKVSPVLSTSP